MKILLASALALTPISSSLIVAGDSDPITQPEIDQRLIVCAKYMTKKLGPSEIITAYNLDTQRKRRDFEIQCNMSQQALDLGYQMAVDDFRKKVL